MIQTLRDWAKQQNVNVGFDQGTGMVSLTSPTGKSVSFKEGSPESMQYGLGYSNYTHYLDPSNTKLSSALGLGQTQTKTPTLQSTYQTNANDILSQIKQNISKQYDYTSNPYYQAQLNLAQQEGEQASRRAMEELNRRNILNSTITGYQVGQAQQEAINARMPSAIQTINTMNQQNLSNLFDLYDVYSGLEKQEYERQLKQDELALEREKYLLDRADTNLKNAWERVKNLGYVDNVASSILGLPVGTPSFEAQKTYDTLQNELNIAVMNNEESMRRTQYTQSQTTARTQMQIQAKREIQNIRDTADKKTNLVITDIMNLNTPQEAFAYIAGENGANAASAGADLNKAMQAIKARWPEYFMSNPLAELGVTAENPQ